MTTNTCPLKRYTDESKTTTECVANLGGIYPATEKHNSESFTQFGPAELINFSTHAMSFKFKILSGTQPKSKKLYKVNNWIGYIFTFKDYTILSTPKSLVIHIKKDLGQGPINDLKTKCLKAAQECIVKFATKHNLGVGEPQQHSNPHFTISQNTHDTEITV